MSSSKLSGCTNCPTEQPANTEIVSKIELLRKADHVLWKIQEQPQKDSTSNGKKAFKKTQVAKYSFSSVERLVAGHRLGVIVLMLVDRLEEITGSSMEVSRSGRARKKSAKLLEMEETEVEFSVVGKAKRKSDPDTALKKSPKTGSPKKKNSLSALFPRVASVLGEVESDHVTDPDDAEPAPLQIDIKTPKVNKRKTNRPSGDVFLGAGDADFSDIQGSVDVTAPRAKKRKTVEKRSPNMAHEVGPLTMATAGQRTPPQALQKESVLDYSFDDDDIQEEYDDDYDDGTTGDDDVSEVRDDAAAAALSHEDDVMSGAHDVHGTSDDETETEDEVTEEEKRMASAVSPPEESKKKKNKTPPKKSQTKAKAAPKVKDKAKAKEIKGKKGRPRTTAYTLWCNNMRRSLMLQYPELDFAQVSRKLSELWDTVSPADKQGLRKKAKFLQRKQDRGEDIHAKPRAVSTHLRSGQSQVMPRGQADGAYSSQNSAYKVTGNEPIDVAAHLKLLGESLGTIGARLQEHRGQIAVQGSLSVLLDSLLCALGPLVCLTNQVPELNAIAMETHKETLDNLAYIMPGIG